MVEIAEMKQHRPDVRPVPFRGGGFAPQPVRHMALILFAALLALAEIGTRSGFISNLTLPRPSAVLETFVQLWKPASCGNTCCHH